MFISVNLYGKEIKPFPWQIEAGNHDNLIIVAPTGAGKSVASYIWAGQKPAKRIIFTAPTKSLSNERWLELKRAGLDVGLLTGDVRRGCSKNPSSGPSPQPLKGLTYSSPYPTPLPPI